MEGRRYRYKGNSYKVLESCKMKDSSKNWVDAVIYRDLNNPDKGKFVRETSQFKARFVPCRLEKGDLVMIISHGKKVGVAKVKYEDYEGNEDYVVLDINQEHIPKVISNNVNNQGFIQQIEHWEFYVYNELTCERRGFKYKE